MKYLTIFIIVLVVFTLLIPSSVFAQESSVDNQFVSSEEYIKIIQRLYELEYQRTNEFTQTIQTIAGIATAGGFGFLAYQTWKLRSERNHTFRAWLGENKPYIGHEAYINHNNHEVTETQWQSMTSEQKTKFDVTKYRRFIEIKNFGNVPAREMKAKGKMFVDKIPGKKELDELNFSSSATVMPNGMVKFYFSVSKDEELSGVNSEKKC